MAEAPGRSERRVWERKEGGERIRLRIIHPEDTGLAAGVLVFQQIQAYFAKIAILFT